MKVMYILREMWALNEIMEGAFKSRGSMWYVPLLGVS
jgi:hypothetical protein